MARRKDKNRRQAVETKAAGNQAAPPPHIGAVVQSVGGNVKVWSEEDLSKITREGYGSNPYVFAAIRQYAVAMGGLSWYVEERKSREWQAVEDHGTGNPAENLYRLLQRPNPRTGGSQFFQNVAGYLKLTGNSYITFALNYENQVQHLYTLRPDRTSVVAGDTQAQVGGYLYEIGGRRVPYHPEAVLHLRSWNPFSDWYGMSDLRPAARAIDASNMAKAWQVALLSNGARPAGILVSQSKLTPEQRSQLREDFYYNFVGTENSGRPLVLEGGQSWQQMSMDNSALQLIEQQKLDAREIAICLGVPPQLLGIPDSQTYSNYAEARKAFYTEGVLPLADFIESELNAWLAPLFGAGLRIRYDRDDIEALQEDRTAVFTRAAQAHWLSVNEKREMCGFTPVDGGETVLVPAGLLPLDMATAPLTLPSVQPVQDAPKSENAPVEHKDLETLSPMSLVTEEQKAAYWRGFERARQTFDRAVESQVTKQFARDIDAVTRAVRQAPSAEEAEVKAMAALTEGLEDWTKLMLGVHRAVAGHFAQRVLTGIVGQKSENGTETKATYAPGPDIEDVFTEQRQEALNAVVIENVGLINQTSMQLIREELAAGLLQGEGIDQLATRLQATWQGVSAYRARLVANTEVAVASNFGSRQAAISTGLPLMKKWVAAGHGDHRADHLALAAEDPRPLNEPYVTASGATLMYPADPHAPANQRINCRCVEVYEVDRTPAS